MADTNIPEIKLNNSLAKQEANRSQQAAQKAELEKPVSDYDTGDHLAARQDILNPNLHFGASNNAEIGISETQSGPVESALDTFQSSTLDSQPITSHFDTSAETAQSSSTPTPSSAAVVHGDEGFPSASGSIEHTNAPTRNSEDRIEPDTSSVETDTTSAEPGAAPNETSFDGAVSVPDNTNNPVTAEDSSGSTSENVSLNGSVNANDLDGDTISYALNGQPEQGAVTLQQDGSYAFNPGTDFDDLAEGESRSVSFDYTADDGKGSTDTGSVTIQVTGTNDAPTAVDLSANGLEENASGAVVGTLSTSDIDTSDSHSYSVSDARFEVVEDNGAMVLKLKDGQSLDHEAEPNVTLTVTSSDGNGGSLDQDFTLNVADLNEAVTAEDSSGSTSENVSLNGSVNATDLDGDTISYALNGQPEQGAVTLQQDGSYAFNPGTDFDDLAEGESRSVSFDYTADDGKGSTDTGSVTIQVTGTNDAPTAVDLSANGLEENASGAVVGTLSTSDIDTSDSHSYSVSDARFEVVEDNGAMVLKLKDGQSLDHEAEPNVTLTVTSSDGNGGSLDQDFTLNVADLNEAVTAEDSSGSTSENVSLNGSVNATDLDGDTISYALNGQPEQGAVTLQQDGSYAFNPGTDFDDLAEGESRSVSFDYTADDGKGSTDTGSVTIQVTGTNDAPTAVDLSANGLEENASGAVVGTLSTSDIDTSDSHSYSVSDARFEVVEDNGAMVLKLKDGQSLDHEAEPNVTLTVTSSDGNGGSLDQDFTLNVADLNEAVTAEDSSGSTSENVSLNGSVNATDLDGDTISYALNGQPEQGAVTLQQDGSYAFNPGTDFDDLAEGESRSVSFDYTADDGKGSTDTGSVTIQVTGTNDAPTAVDLSANGLEENASGAVVGTLSTSDIDTSDSHSYSVSDARFEVVEDNGAMVLKLKDGQSLDHEAEPNVTLTVTSSDGNGGSLDQDFTLNVADLNEAVTAEDSSGSTSENVSLNGSVNATDLDGDTISYALNGQPEQGAVTLQQDGSYAFNPGTDFDDLAEGESRSVSFDYTADDGKGSTDTGSVTIQVTGTNDAPTAVDLSANGLEENASGAVVGTLSTSDIDTSDSHSYSVSDARFEVVEDNGAMVLKLKDGQSLDHEAEPNVTLTVTSSDGNGGSLDQDFTLNVADLNEAVTAEDSSGSTSENVSLNGSVNANDLDGDTISYALNGQPEQGAVTLQQDGSYAFNPGTDFDDLAEGESRSVSFDYTADDGKGSTDTGSVTIQVTGTNDAPTAVDLSANGLEENASGAVVGTLSTSDIDTSDSHSYSVSDARFEVVEDNGAMVLKLKDGQSLDHEAEPNVTLTVTSSDGNGGSLDQDFTLNVADLNEAVTAEDSSGSTSENVSLNGSVNANDLDGDTISYALNGQPEQGAVTLQQDGSYAFNPGTDFDDLAEGESRSVSFDYTADDGKGSTDTGSVTIQVTGTNDAPTAVDLSANGLEENASGAVVGTLSTSDIDTSDSHSYSVSDARFEVVEDNGAMVLKLKDGQSLDHEAEPNVTLTVTSSDGNGGSLDQDFTLNVADLNEAVTAEDSSGSTSENVSLNGSVNATDLDGDTISYALNGQPEQGAVTLQQDGSYAFNPGTDFDDLAEGESRSVSFDYTADDGKGSTDTGSVTIQVTGTNDAPTAVDLSANGLEENASGAVVGTLSTSDIDTSDSHSYSVSDARFEVVEDNGAMVLKLKDGQSLDHEAEPNVTLTVTSSDGNGGSLDQDFTLNVADLNEAVTAEDSSGSTSENVSLNGSVNATDLDGDTISYALNGQPEQGAVTLQQDGSYAFNPGTDFDDLAEGESRSVSFDYTADDGKGSTDTGSVTIQVTGTNDAPTAVDLSANGLEENASGAVVGTLSTSDIDTSDSHSYSVSDARFEVVEDNGAMVLKLKDGQSLDHEAEPNVTLTVTSSDGNGGSLDQDFTLNVADLNEAVTAEDSSGSTSENVSLNGSVNATDLDGDTISYALNGQPEQGAVTLQQDGSYAFNPGTDFDDLAEGESRSVSFDYTADDGKGSTDTGSVTIQVTGTNDAPTAVDLSANGLEENASGAVVGTLSTSDIDTSDSHSYSVSDARFEVVEDNGAMVLKLKDGQSLDHEAEPNVTLTVTSSDGNGGSLDQDFTLNVADLNEAVTAEDSSGSTSENVSLNGSVNATDLDGDTISYALNGQPEQGAVTLQQDGSYAFNPGTDFDDLAEGESRSVSFDYTADDGKGSTDTGSVTIQVTGTNDAPTAVDLSANGLEENASGAVVGTLSTSDIDTSDSHSYSVSDARFEVVEDNGAMVLKLKDGQSLDHEAEPNVTLTVTSSDGNGGSLDQDFTLNVADLNEAVTAEDSSGSTSENVSLNGSVNATDLDGDTISYALNGQPEQGAVTLQQDGSYAFNPGTDFDDLAEGESRSVSFDYTADDGKGSTDTGSVTIQVTGTNDAPTAVDLSANGLEENASGAVVGTLSTSDIDTSDSHSYSVSDARFEVVEDNGAMVLKLKDGQSLDHEAEASIDINVTSTDQGGLSEDQAFQINVADVNEAPSIEAEGSYNFLYNGSFESFSNGTHGGGEGTGWYEGATIDGWTQTNIDVHEGGHRGLGATDGSHHVDLAGQTNGSLSREMDGLEDGQDYTLSMDLKSRGADGNGGGTAEDAKGQSVVEIVWNGDTIATVDPSDDGMGWNNYNFEITGGSGDGSNVITFNEIGSDNNLGTILDNFQITDSNGFGTQENVAGADIANLNISDPDDGDSHSVSVSDDRFEVVNDGGTFSLKLKDDQSLDYESEQSVDVVVTVTDSGGLSDNQTITVDVGDRNEAVIAQDANVSTSENEILDGSVIASDLDGDIISYSLDSQTAEGSVTLDADGSYSFNPGTDFDDLAEGESRSVSFDYTADDGKGSTDTGSVNIEVNGANDVPSALDLSAYAIEEDEAGAVIGSLSTTDVDETDSHSYSVSDDRFEVVEDHNDMILKLKDDQSLDTDGETGVTLTVTSEDEHGGSFDQDFTLEVNSSFDTTDISSSVAQSSSDSGSASDAESSGGSSSSSFSSYSSSSGSGSSSYYYSSSVTTTSGSGGSTTTTTINDNGDVTSTTTSSSNGVESGFSSFSFWDMDSEGDTSSDSGSSWADSIESFGSSSSSSSGTSSDWTSSLDTDTSSGFSDDQDVLSDDAGSAVEFDDCCSVELESMERIAW